MPRPLRIQYAGAIYHLMSRGDRRQAIFSDDTDRHAFLSLLERTCEKTGWQVHAFVLMGNHFHLVVETPQPNLRVGMQWLLGVYTQAYNRRHAFWGHLFGGRYKARLVDERDACYLRTVCDYVHLNPARAGLVAAADPLESYPWSSYPLYLHPTRRPVWLRVDRLLGEHGMALEADAPEMRWQFARRIEAQRTGRDAPTEQTLAELRRGWRLGAEDFLDRLSAKLARRGRPAEAARQRQETDERLAERLIRERLAADGWSEVRLRSSAKGDPWKVSLAAELRRKTPMPRTWIARRLQIGSASYLSALLTVNSKT